MNYSKFRKVTETLLLINVFLLQSYLVRFSIGPYPTNLQEILIFALVAAFLGMKINKKQFREIFVNLRKYIFICAFVFLTTISVLFSDIPQYIDFFRHFKFVFFGITLAYIFLETFQDNKSRIKGLKVMGYGAVAFGLFSAIFNLAGFHNTHDLRLRGPMDSAVALAFYLVPFFIFFTVQFFKNLNKKNNLILALILFGLILATKSMGAIGGSFLIILFFLFKNSEIKFLKKKSVKFALIFMAILLAVAIFYTKILPTFQTNYSSLDERGEIWQIAIFLLQDLKTIFLGIGFGQFEHYFIQEAIPVLNRPPLDWHPLHPHNIFLLYLFNYGILGLAMIIFVLIKISINLLSSKKLNDLQLIVNLILLYFFIHGLIDSPYFKNDMTFLMLLFLEMGIYDAASKPWTKSIKAA